MSKQIKILFIINDLSVGGAQIRTIRLANGLSRRGFWTSIASLGKTDHISKELSDDIDFSFSKHFDYLQSMTVFSSSLSSLYSLYEVIKLIRSTNPDIVCAMQWAAKIPASLAGKLLGKKTVLVEVNNSIYELRLKGVKSRLHPKFFARKIACRLATAVAANSRGLADFTASCYGLTEVALIHNGTDIEAVRRMSSEPVESQWSDEEDARLVVAVGRLERQKGFEFLIEAIKLLNTEGTRVRLLILGEGTMRESLERKVADCGIGDMVRMSGFVTNPYPHMAGADVFVCSSVSEGMSNTILEAMALGLPVVSTDHEFGASDVIKHGDSGLLVPVGDSKAMASSIRDVIEDEKLRGKLVRGAEIAVREFNMEAMVEKHKHLFTSIVKR